MGCKKIALLGVLEYCPEVSSPDLPAKPDLVELAAGHSSALKPPFGRNKAESTPNQHGYPQSFEQRDVDYAIQRCSDGVGGSERKEEGQNKNIILSRALKKMVLAFASLYLKT